ncbi:hypothetical protein ES708_00469 [subsurface metagenome]|jgi:hypothetical protein
MVVVDTCMSRAVRVEKLTRLSRGDGCDQLPEAIPFDLCRGRVRNEPCVRNRR